MQFKKLFLLLLANIFCLSVYSQQDIEFPVSGTYAIQGQEYEQTKIFNRVVVSATSYVLKLDEEPVRYYNLTGVTENEQYQVERFYPEREIQPAEKERFTIRVVEIDGHTVRLILTSPYGSETVDLIKL